MFHERFAFDVSSALGILQARVALETVDRANETHTSVAFSLLPRLVTESATVLNHTAAVDELLAQAGQSNSKLLGGVVTRHLLSIQVADEDNRDDEDADNQATDSPTTGNADGNEDGPATDSPTAGNADGDSSSGPANGPEDTTGTTEQDDSSTGANADDAGNNGGDGDDDSNNDGNDPGSPGPGGYSDLSAATSKSIAMVFALTAMGTVHLAL